MTALHYHNWTGAKGKRVVMTGATSGIGLAAAEALAARGAKLTLIARSRSRAQHVADRTGADVVIADLASNSAVRRAAEEILGRYDRIDALVNNAGVYLPMRTLTTDWIETTWAINHLAPFLLTNLLLERLVEGAPARIVTTASDAHSAAEIPFDDLDGEAAYAKRSIAGAGFVRYGQTKLANILFTSELARLLEGTGVTANCFHPGHVATGITRELTGAARLSITVMKAFSRRPAQGADTLVWLVDSPDVDAVSGAYFVDRRQATPSRSALDADAARRLWEVSLEQTGIAATVGM
ncbi:MAG TPA: SDR family NAD(P)-dependent oxidoreductase [Candidatus Dormibacteraeota bacterium]|nr:SDR family NAD(P)-dependent oxidoreductase [Candidatus Dormibacteraeota bacterium]